MRSLASNGQMTWCAQAGSAGGQLMVLMLAAFRII